MTDAKFDIGKRLRQIARQYNLKMIGEVHIIILDCVGNLCDLNVPVDSGGRADSILRFCEDFYHKVIYGNNYYIEARYLGSYKWDVLMEEKMTADFLVAHCPYLTANQD